MPVRAIWHDDLAVDDPPEAAGAPLRPAASGDEGDLNRRLAATIVDEGELYEQGITCEIKDKTAATCHACPLFRNDGSPMARLCEIGREQERLQTEIIVAMRTPS